MAYKEGADEGVGDAATAVRRQTRVLVNDQSVAVGGPGGACTRRFTLLRRRHGNWNGLRFSGAPFERAAEFAGTRSGTVAIIGGPAVFDLFMDRYDVFWLSRAQRVSLPGGEPCFSGVPAQRPEQILAAHGLNAGETQILDAAQEVSVTPWRRES